MFDKEFYPTPKALVTDMLKDIDIGRKLSILEPSSGKGDIVEGIRKAIRRSEYIRDDEVGVDIDAIEINPDLRHILKGKQVRIVHDDFLTFDTLKRYDLIVMNPPFSAGDVHLLKALSLLAPGGILVCILNAETIRNPFTNIRRQLTRKLEELGASIEYHVAAFADAERKTDVEIAIVRLTAPDAVHASVLLDGLRREEELKPPPDVEPTAVVESDFIRGIVARCQFEQKAGLKIIAEYNALRPYMLKLPGYDGANPACILELNVIYPDERRHGNRDDATGNMYIREIRRKYWEALFQAPEFVGRLTKNLQQDLYSRVNELADYDFSLYNIYSIRAEMGSNVIQGIKDTIVALFDTFSHKHHWYDETSKNVHYFDGWKTNKAWYVGKKVIIPLSIYNQWGTSWIDAVRRLVDIEKTFDFLAGKISDNNIELCDRMEKAQQERQTQKIDCKYFTVTFYKKGTCHIEFTNLDLLKKFNIFGCQQKKWLPPSYGETAYADMGREEQAVVDAFEGEASYRQTVARSEYFLCNFESVALLGMEATA